MRKPVDFFVAKGIVEGLLHQLNVSDRVEFVQSERKNMHPGRTANILLNGSLAGFIGQVHPAMEKELDIKETYVFELDLHALLTEETEPVVYTPIPKYPSVTRDIALVADKTVTSGQLEAVIKEAGGALLKEVTVFDVYEGEHMEEGKKSVAFSLQYVNPEQTLTEEEVTKVHENVLKALEETYQAVLRG